jgi:hypothetical protein
MTIDIATKNSTIREGKGDARMSASNDSVAAQIFPEVLSNPENFPNQTKQVPPDR